MSGSATPSELRARPRRIGRAQAGLSRQRLISPPRRCSAPVCGVLRECAASSGVKQEVFRLCRLRQGEAHALVWVDRLVRPAHSTVQLGLASPSLVVVVVVEVAAPVDHRQSVSPRSSSACHAVEKYSSIAARTRLAPSGELSTPVDQRLDKTAQDRPLFTVEQQFLLLARGRDPAHGMSSRTAGGSRPEAYSATVVASRLPLTPPVKSNERGAGASASTSTHGSLCVAIGVP